jgi:hypothetical protein
MGDARTLLTRGARGWGGFTGDPGVAGAEPEGARTRGGASTRVKNSRQGTLCSPYKVTWKTWRVKRKHAKNAAR